MLSDEEIATRVCHVMRGVQTQLTSSSAVGGAYLAQFTLGLAQVLTDADTVYAFQQKGDALAQRACPQEYREFLRQAGISSITHPS